MSYETRNRFISGTSTKSNHNESPTVGLFGLDDDSNDKFVDDGFYITNEVEIAEQELPKVEINTAEIIKRRDNRKSYRRVRRNKRLAEEENDETHSEIKVSQVAKKTLQMKIGVKDEKLVKLNFQAQQSNWNKELRPTHPFRVLHLYYRRRNLRLNKVNKVFT